MPLGLTSPLETDMQSDVGTGQHLQDTTILAANTRASLSPTRQSLPHPRLPQQMQDSLYQGSKTAGSVPIGVSDHPYLHGHLRDVGGNPRPMYRLERQSFAVDAPSHSVGSHSRHGLLRSFTDGLRCFRCNIGPTWTPQTHSAILRRHKVCRT